MFENVDIHTHIRTTDAYLYYKLTFGSGELKTNSRQNMFIPWSFPYYASSDRYGTVVNQIRWNTFSIGKNSGENFNINFLKNNSFHSESKFFDRLTSSVDPNQTATSASLRHMTVR